MRRDLALTTTLIPAMGLVAAIGLETSRQDAPDPGTVLDAPFSHEARASEDERSAWLDAAYSVIEQAEYEVTASDRGLQAPNRAHNLRTRFRADGVELVPRTGPAGWRVQWITTSTGRESDMRLAEDVEPVSDGGRVTYPRGNLVEWYVNDIRGVEQGFTLDERLPGTGPLVVEGRLETTLAARQRADGGGIHLDDAYGRPALVYDKLVATDATEATLPARMELVAGVVRLVVDDTGAEYPVVIDPLLSTFAWSAESDQEAAEMGFSVSTAGDVNGDGFSDVLVGAPFFDDGESGEGRVYLFHGSPTGPSPSPDWVANGDLENVELGYAVGPAGDVNGDGYDDIIASAPRYPGATGWGRAFVWHGGAGGLGADGTPANADWYADVERSTPLSSQGMPVSTAGDVNGDGIADIVVGSPRYSNGEVNEGAAFVWYGSVEGLGDPGTPQNADWRAELDAAGDLVGSSVACAGDVDGDGYDDLIVGAAQWEDDTGTISEGAAFVWLGGPSGLGPTGTEANAHWFADGDQFDSQMGYSVAGAGDVNGDGYADVLIGAPFYDTTDNNAGEAYLYYGGPSGLGTPDRSADFTMVGEEPNAHMGFVVAAAGDVNGDGYADFAATQPLWDAFGFANTGWAGVWLGAPEQPDPFSEWGRWGSIQSEFGFAAGTAGDVNGDGFSDFIVGIHLFNSGETDEGRAVVYLGSAASLPDDESWHSFILVSDVAFGTSVASAGDVNGDGYSDMIVGAPLYDVGEVDEGRAFVYYGGPGELPTSPSWAAESDQTSARLGASVAGAGDVNGDGYDDVIVGASLYDNGEDKEGALFVWYGGPDGLPSDPTVNTSVATAAWHAESNSESAWFGDPVGSAGDVNGDGYADVFGTAFFYSNPEEDEGAVFIWYGSAEGLGPDGTPDNADWRAESNKPNAAFGIGAGCAGDVNGDGFDDFLIGSSSLAAKGTALAWYGGSDGLGTNGTPENADWRVDGDIAQQYGSFGTDAATAGDVNGDGYADVIIGAPFHTTLADREGAAYVYHGSPGGLMTTHAWMGTDTVNRGRYAAAVSSAGDVNGDGYSDIVVGAYKYVPGDIGPGRAFLYLGSADGVELEPDWEVVNPHTESAFGTAIACAGDMNGDGYSDVVFGAPTGLAGGFAWLYMGNAPAPPVPNINVRQRRTDDFAPIALGGRSDSPEAFRMVATGRSPAGRTRVALEWEVQPAGSPFDGTDLQRSFRVVTGEPGPDGSLAALDEIIGGLSGDTAYHWRARVVSASPYFPRSPWVSPPGNSPTATDLRTPAGPVAVGEPQSPMASPLRVEPPYPNPFIQRTRVALSLDREARVDVSVHDVSGRLVVQLIGESLPAGRHTVSWDGRDARGLPVSGGVYLARIDVDGVVATRKLTYLR